jgi:hypothetical protein
MEPPDRSYDKLHIIMWMVEQKKGVVTKFQCVTPAFAWGIPRKNQRTAISTAENTSQKGFHPSQIRL